MAGGTRAARPPAAARGLLVTRSLRCSSLARSRHWLQGFGCPLHQQVSMEVLGDIAIANPLADEEKLDKELERDSDAVVSTFYPEQRKAGELMSNSNGGPSALYRLQQAATGAYAVCHWLFAPAGYADRSGLMSKPNQLNYVSAAFGGCALMLVLVPLESARISLQPGGTLQQLGVGTQSISSRDYTSLARWRMILAAVCAVFQLMWPMLLIGMIVDWNDPEESTWPVRINKIAWALWALLVVPVILLGWFPTMYTASCLCRDNVTEVLKRMQVVDPAADDGQEWKRSVEVPALELRLSMRTLSEGYGPGLLGLGSTCCLFGLAFFCNAINAEMSAASDQSNGNPPGTHRDRTLMLAVAPPFLALLLARDLATTSSYCDLLMDKLNDADIAHGVEHHDKIDWLTITLKRLVRFRSNRVTSPSLARA